MMRAERSTVDTSVALPDDGLSARSDAETIVTNLDGSPLEPERVWHRPRTVARADPAARAHRAAPDPWRDVNLRRDRQDVWATWW